MPPTTNRRGLQDIRTNAGRVTTPGGKQRAYLRLCTLEMERQRRDQEHRAAAQQARIAAERVAKLQREMDEIIATLSPQQQHAARNAINQPPNTPTLPEPLTHHYGPKPTVTTRPARPKAKPKHNPTQNQNDTATEGNAP
jgi:hypothetical protein